MNDAPDFKPLYVQVKDLVVRRVVAGEWRPGDALPSEQSLAAEFRVSQGTVRKALDELAQQNLVERRQGKGTFVAAHTPQRALFHFFHISGDDGARALPDSRVLKHRAAKASRAEALRLGLAAGDAVIRIERLRLLGARPAIHERLVLPAALFPSFDPEAVPLPNELYLHYERVHGVTVARAVEKLKAVSATAEEARALGLTRGAPLLEIDRLATTLDRRAVEWRVSRCDTTDHHYLSEIT